MKQFGNMQKWVLVFWLLAECTFRPALAGIENKQVEKNGTLEFSVLMERFIEFPNRHSKLKEKPMLRFSLMGATIEEIKDTLGSSPLQLDDQSSAESMFDADWDMGHWTLSLSDATSAQISITDYNNVTSYILIWPGTEVPHPKRELCFDYSNGHWYNSYQRYSPEFPLNSSQKMDKTQFNYLLDFHENTQREEFVFVLEHLFLSSDGFAVLLDPSAPLFIRRDPDSLICISVNNSYPYLENNPSSNYRDIKLQIFAASNVKQVWDHLLSNSELIPKPKTLPSMQAFTNTRWSFFTQNPNNVHQDRITEVANYIEKEGYFSGQHEFIIDGTWQNQDGDYKLSSWLFSDSNTQVIYSRINKDRFHLTLQVKPIIHETNQENHREQHLQDHKQKRLLSNLDFSNKQAISRFESALSRLSTENDIFAFYASSDALSDFYMRDYAFRLRPNLYANAFIEAVARSTPQLSSTKFAFKTQHLPMMLQLEYPRTAEHASSDQYYDSILKFLVPNVLSVSLAGYSFIIPYHVGGYWPSARPSEEIYIRMLQATALMPAINFDVNSGPWHYSQNAQDITKKMVQLHQKYVPTIMELAEERVSIGSPIIRPMWYAAPEDEDAFQVADQFMLGDDIVVAPVTEKNVRQRYVYLPPGEWHDHHGEYHKGPKTKLMGAELDELIYFTRTQ